LTVATVKPNDYVYNCITQPDAATQSRTMYNSNTSNFTSDLMNSFAWDTAIVFLQEFDNRTSKPKAYSIQSGLNSSLAEKGTNNSTNTAEQDIICNIWDMASNNREWTTETYPYSYKSWVSRGGLYNLNTYYTSIRCYDSTSTAYDRISFRPILYLKN